METATTKPNYGPIQPGVDPKWNLTNLPLEGHKDVGPFMWGLFKVAELEKNRIKVPERSRANYRLYRGDHWQKTRAKRDANKTTVNLYFANIQRTKSNITARNPVAEVIDMDGINDMAARILTARLKKWWKDTGQKKKLSTTALKNEKYGITIEKPFWNNVIGEPDMAIVDIFGFFPAPGYYDDIALQAPYVCFADALPVEQIEKSYNAKPGSVEASDVYSILGEDREDYRPMPLGTRETTVNYSSGLSPVANPRTDNRSDARQNRGLVVEVWVRDNSTVTEKRLEEFVNERSGAITYDEVKVTRPKYPGGIRRVTLTNNGKLVLEDVANPNINPNMDVELTSQSWLFKRFPVIVANSYEDTTSIWGFSAAEQVSDLVVKIDEIFSKLTAFVKRAMFPPLVIPRNCGITRKMLNDKPNLVIMPTNVQAAQFIRFLPLPSLPGDIYKVLDLYLNFFDRVYQIEDADRGTVPSRVIAAAAIVALQERNMVLMQDKMKAIEHVCECRGKAAISLYQNFGWEHSTVKVDDEPTLFRGIDYVGQKFNYTVEAGSTMPKTSLQVQEQLERFYEMGIVDRQAVLEGSGLPGWRRIIERIGEGQLNQALQVLVQAGLPTELAVELRNMLLQNQGGPGDIPKQQTAELQGVAGVEQ